MRGLSVLRRLAAPSRRSHVEGLDRPEANELLAVLVRLRIDTLRAVARGELAEILAAHAGTGILAISAAANDVDVHGDDGFFTSVIRLNFARNGLRHDVHVQGHRGEDGVILAHADLLRVAPRTPWAGIALRGRDAD